MRKSLFVSFIFIVSCKNINDGRTSLDVKNYNRALLEVFNGRRADLSLRDIGMLDSIYMKLKERPIYHYQNMASLLITNRKFEEFYLYYLSNRRKYTDSSNYMIAFAIYQVNNELGKVMIRKASKIKSCDSNIIKVSYFLRRIINDNHRTASLEVRDVCSDKVNFIDRYRKASLDEIMNELLPR